MPDTRHQFEKGEPVNPYKKIYRNCLARAIGEADLNTAMEMEASHHYGDKFTRFDQGIFWIRSFLTCFINPQRRNKDPQMHSHNLKALTKKPQPGTSQDMLKLLRIQVSETFVVEFDSVDTRFNDCSNWQVMKGEERVLFSTRMYEQFRDVKSGLMATVQVCEGRPEPSDERMLAAAKAMLSLLDKYPSFASLAAHPGRIDN